MSAVRQALRWTLSGVTCSVLNPSILRGCHVRRALSTTCGVRCSQLGHGSAASQAHGEQQSRELLDMGLTASQAELVSELASRNRQAALPTLTALLVLGLNPSSVVKAIEKCPELCSVKSTELQHRIGNLRKLGLVEGSLQRLVSYYPQILTIAPKRMQLAVRFLRENCLFTSQQITDILRDSPAVMQEDLIQLEHKFQYVYFRMGVKQPEILRARLFRAELEQVRFRHCFLERRGLYQTPDKKGQTSIVNPKLSDVINSTQKHYLSQVAMATQEEYDVFRKLLAREWQEEESLEKDLEAGADEEDEEDEEEEEEEKRRDSYQKRKR